MSVKEGPHRALRAVIDAMNNGENTAGLTNMTDNVVIIDDIPPFHRTGRQEAELWFRRLAVARDRLGASLKLDDADIRVDEDKAYIVAPGLFSGALEGEDVTVNGTLTATLVQRQGTWLVDGLIWSCML
jgi:ketosteroid isomerase-like protein